jgi:hypothetical protein
MSPFAIAGRHDFPEMVDELVPGSATMLDNVVIVF